MQTTETILKNKAQNQWFAQVKAEETHRQFQKTFPLLHKIE